MAKRVPPEHAEAIVAAYLNGASQQQAAALFGYSGDACRKALLRRGILLRSRTDVCRIPMEHEEAIVAAYLAGSTMQQAADLFGYSGNACLNALRRRGITPRSHAEVCRIPFEHEEAMIAAYMSGSSTAQAASLFGYSPQTCTNVLLHRLGLHNRKSLTVEPCRLVPDLLLSAYWRGIVDGDGSISCSTMAGTSTPQWQVSLVGNKAIVSGFHAFVARFVPSKATVRPHKKIFAVRYGGVKTSRAVAQLLYADATIYLERKYARAQKLLDSR